MGARPLRFSRILLFLRYEGFKERPLSIHLLHLTMTVTVKKKTPLVVPPAIQRPAGLTVGKQVEFRASGGVITITPKLPAADDEYTPAQRRVIDASLADARKGPYYGPFDTADEAVKFLRKEIRTRKTGKRKPSGL
jgi:hypothetical protein